MSTTAVVAQAVLGGIRNLTRGEKIGTVAYIFVIILAWCAVRSILTGEGANVAGQAIIATGIRVAFLVSLLVPIAFFAALRLPLGWLLGLSACVGQMPGVPLLPFIQDYAHAITLAFAVYALFSGALAGKSTRAPLFAWVFAAYIAVCAISATLNYMGHGNIWQAKVGVSFLMLFIPVAFLIFTFSLVEDRASPLIDPLLDGFVWGAITHGIIGALAIPALIAWPSTAGNDTLYGLGYYYRYKGTFSGPVSFAFFIIVSVPLILLWAQRIGRLPWAAAAYLQFSPWLLMATASRAGRVAAIVPFLMLLRHKETRKHMVMILPSAAIAYWLCFYYVSLPAAIEAVTGVLSDPSMEMSDRYFESSERTELVKETVHSMLKAPWIVDLFGNGPGVGGYSTSGFPAAHNMIMNVWVETGAVGVLLFIAFVLALLIALLRVAFSRSDHASTAWIVTASLAGFGLANAAYQTVYWGYALVLIFIAICATRTVSTSAKP